MITKRSKQTIIYTFTLGISIIFAAILSGGHHIGMLIPAGTGLIISGPVMVFSYKKNKKEEDRECDEREKIITQKAMEASFYSMTIVMSSYWSYDVTLAGTLLRFSTLLLFLLWGSFITAYIIYKYNY